MLSTDSPADAMNGIEEPPEEGEVDSNAPVPNKVHLRGLDNLNTDHVRQYAEEHYSLDLFSKVQWVDDTSANLVYDTELAATEALAALSSDPYMEPMQIRPAKPFSAHPNMMLEVRQAIVADVKIQNAKDRSRFYLFNPEWDPDNRPRKRRRPDDHYRSRGKHPRREWEEDRHSRRPRSRDVEFHEDMYDEGARPSDGERRNSDSEYGRRRVQYEEAGDLMPAKASGRLRDRSASPERDGDGRYGFEERFPRRRTPPPRSRTPPGIRPGRDNHRARDQVRKELFPDRKSTPDSRMNGPQAHTPRPSSAGSTSRELFPDKLNGSVHRRQDAKDLHPDEVASAFGRSSISSAAATRDDRSAYGGSGRRTEYDGRGGSNNGSGRDLFSRIGNESTHGRLQSDGVKENGYSIKGADAGFNIRGASDAVKVQNPLVRELFPVKAGGGENAGRELFDGRIKGRGVRRRAEDMF